MLKSTALAPEGGNEYEHAVVNFVPKYAEHKSHLAVLSTACVLWKKGKAFPKWL